LEFGHEEVKEWLKWSMTNINMEVISTSSRYGVGREENLHTHVLA